jgi:sugar lactone lactonase YvrE
VSTLFGGQGAVRLRTPTGIAVGPDGTVYVSDTNNYRIVAVLASGAVITYGTGSSGYLDHANPQKAAFNRPRGLAVDGSGALYVADFRNNAIRRIDDSGVTTVAGDLGGPTAVAIGEDGRMYYLATWWGSVVRLEPDGTLTLLANPSMVQGDQSGVGADAALRPADGLCVTANGLVFSDTGNNRMRGMAFDEQSTVSTVLGSGEAGAGSGAGAATQVVLPRGLTAFNGGYAVADSANHRILWFSA